MGMGIKSLQIRLLGTPQLVDSGRLFWKHFAGLASRASTFDRMFQMGLTWEDGM